MLTNPYPHKLDSADLSGKKFQADIHPGDKALLMSLRPSKGTIQLVVNNLIKNLCDDLRELNVTGWLPDGDNILTILTERRDYSEEQLERLRHTTVCTSGSVPPRLLVNQRRRGVREKVTESKAKSTDSPKRTPRRVKRVGEASDTPSTESQQNTTESS